MVSIEGVDYSESRPSPTGLAAAGIHFAVRYVGALNTKFNLTPAEAKSLADAGLWICVVFETQPNRALVGRQGGQDDAKKALAAATTCGMPDGRPIYFAVDFDPNASQIAAVKAYFQGIQDVLGPRSGVYGGLGTIQAADSLGITWLWQTYAWSGHQDPATGKWVTTWHPKSVLQQYQNGVVIAGGTLDRTRAVANDYGQWIPGKLPVNPSSPLAPSQEDKVYRLINTVDTKRLYLVSASKIILATPDVLDAFKAMGVIQNPGASDDALQIQVDRAAAAIRGAVA